MQRIAGAGNPSLAAWLLAASVLACALVVGCDSKDATPQPSSGSASPAPTSAPSTQAADSIAPTTQPSTLLIDGKPIEFPPAKLRVSKTDGHVVARLYTNDPKAALADDYHGNGYDLLMQLDDINSPAEIYNAVWDFKAASHDSPTTPYGIFLDGIRYQLVPSQVTAHFIGDSLMVRVDLQGQFIRQNQTDPNDPSKLVNVSGRLLAPVEYKD
jgi:hypothetical protein